MLYDLLDICDFQGGTQPPKDKWIKEPKDGYVRMLQIRDYSQSDDKFIEYVKDSEQLHKCKKDDIMLSRYGYIGQAFMGLEGAYNVALVKVIKKNSVNTKYLYYYFKSNVFKHYLLSNVGARATIPGFNKSELKDTKINIKPLDEQIQIVKILERCEDVINKLNKEIEDFDLLIKARFIEVFGDISVNDKKWEGHPLGELCTIVRGGSPRPIERYLGGDVPWIKIGDATDEENIYLHSTKEHIIADGVKKSRLVKAGSLIFANCGVSLGFARIITFDGCIHDGWLAMENIDTRLDKVFLLQTLNQMTDHFREIAPAGTQPNLNTTIMKAYLQIVPPMELQQEFISFVKQVDKSKFHCFFVNKNDIRRYRLNLTIQFMNHI